jgi:hypothetical protein
MSEAKRSNRVPKDRKAERWHVKRVRKKGQSRKQEAHEQLKLRGKSNKEIFKKKGRTITHHLPFIIRCLHSPMTKVTF